MIACATPIAALLLVVASWLVQLVVAGPLVLVSGGRRDVANPPVISPNASTVWVVGQTETVLWDTSNLPQQITNLQGQVVLGFLNDSSGNEHLMIDNPLASGFDIRSGQVNIIVPDVEPRADYIIALMGDSGNISDMFTITNSTVSAIPSTPASTSSASEGTPSVDSPTETEASPSSTPTTPNVVPTSTVTASTATSTVTAVATSGALEGQTSSSVPASQISSSSDVSAAFLQMPAPRLVTSAILTLCMFILA